MKGIEIIEANLNDKVNSVLHTKKKACAYARVSTDQEEQLTSYSSQIKHYSEMIKSNPDLEYVGVYADEGISGTQVKNRKAFTKMIDDALNGKIDLIIAKSISRFARNTLDTLKYIRMLREKKVDVYFEKENIHTLHLSSEMFLTLYSAFAQAESESISQNVKLGLVAKMKRGEIVGRASCYGYTWNTETKQLEINEHEAEIVRMIFEKYVSGKGNRIIARELNEAGYKTPKGKKWSDALVSKIIHQEKYCGDLMQQKTFTLDVLSHKRVKNNGELKKFYVKNHHEPIISREMWAKANDISKKRLQVFTDNNRYRIGLGELWYEFSNKIECGCCHKSYVRRINGRKKDGGARVYWACTTRKNKKSECLNQLWLRNEMLESMFVELYNKLISNKHKTKQLFLESIEDTLKSNNYKEKIVKLQSEKDVLEEKLLNLIDIMLEDYSHKDIYIAKENELKQKLNEIDNELDKYRHLQSNEINYSDKINKISKMLNKFKKLDEFDKETFNSIVDKIIVGSKDDDGNFNPNIIRFILKTNNEVDFDIENKKTAPWSNLEGSKYIWWSRNRK